MSVTQQGQRCRCFPSYKRGKGPGLKAAQVYTLSGAEAPGSLRTEFCSTGPRVCPAAPFQNRGYATSSRLRMLCQSMQEPPMLFNDGIGSQKRPQTDSAVAQAAKKSAQQSFSEGCPGSAQAGTPPRNHHRRVHALQEEAQPPPAEDPEASVQGGGRGARYGCNGAQGARARRRPPQRFRDASAGTFAGHAH